MKADIHYISKSTYIQLISTPQVGDLIHFHLIKYPVNW